MAMPTSENDVTVRKLSKVIGGTDGTGGLWGKIKDDLASKADDSSVLHTSDKNAVSGVAGLDSYGYLSRNLLPQKNFYNVSARVIKICRVLGTTSNSGNSYGLELLCRWGSGSAKIFINMHGSYTVSIVGNGINDANKIKFYRAKVTVDTSTYIDLYAEVVAYHRCIIIPSNLMPSSYADFSVYNTNATLPTGTEDEGGAVEIEKKFIAQTSASSGTNPVKTDAYGNLTAVVVDSSPTAGNTTHLVSSDGVKTALDGKEDENNKVTAWQSTPDNTHYPSEKLVKAEFDKSSDVIIEYYTESSRTHKYWKFAQATFSGNSRYLFSEWDVILQTDSTYYPFKLIFEAYKSSSSAISIKYAKIVDVKSGTSVDALGATEFYVKTQDGTAAPLKIELWCGLNRDNQSSIALKELRAGLAPSVNTSIDTRANSWTYYPNDGSETTSTTKPVTGDGYTVTQFTQMSDKFAYYAERIGKPSTTDGKSVVTSQVGSKSIPVYVKSDGSIDTCDVKSTYIPTGTGSDAPVNGKALAAALAGGVDTAKQVVNNDNNVKYKLDSGGLDVYDEQSGQRNSGTKVGISGVEINSGTTESTTLNSSGLDLLKNGQHVKVSHSGFVGPLTGNVTGNVSGSAGSLDVNDVVGGPTVPVYIKADGTPEACTLALNSDVLPITSEKELSSDELTTYTNFLIVNNAKVKIYFERLQPGAAYKFYNPQGSYCDLCFARESNMTCYRTWNSSTEQLQTSVFVSPPSLQRMMGMAVVVRVGTKAYVAGY